MASPNLIAALSKVSSAKFAATRIARQTKSRICHGGPCNGSWWEQQSSARHSSSLQVGRSRCVHVVRRRRSICSSVDGESNLDNGHGISATVCSVSSASERHHKFAAEKFCTQSHVSLVGTRKSERFDHFWFQTEISFAQHCLIWQIWLQWRCDQQQFACTAERWAALLCRLFSGSLGSDS